jgi:hypothetical protein
MSVDRAGDADHESLQIVETLKPFA